MKKVLIIVIILAVLLVSTISYILIDKYQEKKLEIYQQGAQFGYEQAMIQIIQQAITCQQVPLRIGNETINIIAVGCLQQG